MSCEPGRDGLNRAVWQDLNQTMGFQIYNDGSVGPTLPKSKIIQSDLGEWLRSTSGVTLWQRKTVEADPFKPSC